MVDKNKIPEKKISRLILYRKLVRNLIEDGNANVFSYKLAKMAGCSADQVRRDVMDIGCTGSNAHGYNLEEIFTGIDNYLDTCKNNKVVLVGAGNLGRSVLSYCDQRHSKISIIAAFDRNKELAGTVIQGCHCYHIDELRNFVKDNNIKVGIATVRSESAEGAVNELVNAGIKGILNFTPKQLNVPDNVYVENVDMMMSLEKVIYITGNY